MSDSIIIPLTQGFSAIIDAEDADRVLVHPWHAHEVGPGRFYAATIFKGERSTTYLHRFVMNAEKGRRVDHKNRKPFDCRKRNLRYCTPGQNAANAGINPKNTTGYKGVNFNLVSRGCKPWRTCIRGNYIGRFETAEEAAHAYDRAARELYGGFALTNSDLGLI